MLSEANSWVQLLIPENSRVQPDGQLNPAPTPSEVFVEDAVRAPKKGQSWPLTCFSTFTLNCGELQPSPLSAYQKTHTGPGRCMGNISEQALQAEEEKPYGQCVKDLKFLPVWDQRTDHKISLSSMFCFAF